MSESNREGEESQERQRETKGERDKETKIDRSRDIYTSCRLLCVEKFVDG